MFTPRTLSAITAALEKGDYNPTVPGAGRYMCTVLGWRHGSDSIAVNECGEALKELQYMLGVGKYGTLFNTVNEFLCRMGNTTAADIEETERVCLAYYQELAALYKAEPLGIVCGATMLEAFCRAVDKTVEGGVKC